MITLPKINNLKKKTKKYLFSFGGINKSESFSPGELETSENAGFEAFPSISARNMQKTFLNQKSSDLFCAKGLIRVYDYSDTEKYICRLGESGSWKVYSGFSKDEKEIASVGNIITVFPDKKYLDLSQNIPEWKNMENKLSFSQQSGKMSNDRIKFIKAESYNSFVACFKEGDVLTFWGGYYDGNITAERWSNKKVTVRAFEKDSLTVIFDPYTFGFASTSDMTSCTFEKSVPDLKMLCSWCGRLWGVDKDNNICASKYMDPTNFEYFDLSAADSFTIETDTEGDFTASAPMDGHIAFFKENKIHRITGTKPSNYRHTVIDTKGVKNGSERSVAIIDGNAYYEGTEGIYVYNGGLSRLISERLGSFSHSSGVGAVQGKKYYISLKTKEGSTLYCYDTEKAMWLRDGETEFKAAVNYMGWLYFLDKDGVIMKMTDEREEDEEFSVTFREITENFSEQKGFSKLYLGYKLEEGGRIMVETSYGKNEPFKTAAVFTDHRKTVSEIRLEPNRSDFVRIRLTATPDAVIRNIMREHYEHNSLF